MRGCGCLTGGWDLALFMLSLFTFIVTLPGSHSSLARVRAHILQLPGQHGCGWGRGSSTGAGACGSSPRPRPRSLATNVTDVTDVTDVAALEHPSIAGLAR